MPVDVPGLFTEDLAMMFVQHTVNTTDGILSPRCHSWMSKSAVSLGLTT